MNDIEKLLEALGEAGGDRVKEGMRQAKIAAGLLGGHVEFDNSIDHKIIVISALASGLAAILSKGQEDDAPKGLQVAWAVAEQVSFISKHDLDNEKWPTVCGYAKLMLELGAEAALSDMVLSKEEGGGVGQA